MKKTTILFLIGFFMLTPSSVLAANWINLGTYGSGADSKTIYVDNSSIIKDGESRTAWNWTTLDVPDCMGNVCLTSTMFLSYFVGNEICTLESVGIFSDGSNQRKKFKCKLVPVNPNTLSALLQNYVFSK